MTLDTAQYIPILFDGIEYLPSLVLPAFRGPLRLVTANQSLMQKRLQSIT